jgi:two-component system response regulator HydG
MTARILVVDDNAERRRSVEQPLVLAGHHVTGVATPAEAQALRASAPFDLLITGALDTIPVSVGTRLEEVERLLIAETLRRTGGNKQRAAGLLGIAARTIYRKLAANARSDQPATVVSSGDAAPVTRARTA